MHLNLVRHRFRAGLVPVGEGGAEGSQLRVGAKFAGLVVPPAFFRTAIGELDEIDGNAAHEGAPWDNRAIEAHPSRRPPPLRGWRSSVDDAPTNRAPARAVGGKFGGDRKGVG